MDLSEAIARIENNSKENKAATKQLHDAAGRVARYLEDTVPVGIKLPRNYRVCKVKSNVGSALFLVGHHHESGDEFWVDGQGSYLHGDFHAWVPDQTRAGSLQFAHDIRDGLLDEIATFLAERARQAEAATAVLTQAIED